MEETVKQEKPSIREQIDFVHGARKVLEIPTAQVVFTAKDQARLKAIEENLITVKRLNDNVAKVGQNFQEILTALIEAKTLIKQWHCNGMSDSAAERTWKVYDSISPEMIRINAIISKYEKLNTLAPPTVEGESNIFPNEGKLNGYVCSKDHYTATIDRDPGVTSFLIDCPICGNEAQSRMYRVSQNLNPTHEWYKPTDAELEARRASMSVNSYRNMMDHVKQGGLLFRKIGDSHTKEVTNG